tara:strand:+ start:2501 stop:3001 length:501 start_codon:yes stop_codon:yes gene_type:complete
MIPHVLKDGTIFVDGVGYGGIVTSMTPPEITLKTEDHRGGGMDGPIAIDQGMEGLTFKFELAEFIPDMASAFGRTEGDGKPIVFRFSLEKGASVKPLIITLRGGLTKDVIGDYKPGEEGKFSYEGAAKYYRAQMDGAVVYEIDFENAVRIMNGEDQLAGRRAALGI